LNKPNITMLMLNKHFSKFVILILCLFLTQVSFAQERKLSGKVSDEKGIALPGVTVTIKETNQVVSTDDQGSFTINVTSNGKNILFKYLGMEDQEVLIGNKSIFNITLNPSQTTLADVVIVGYGAMKKSDLTGSVARVTRDELNKDVPTNILQALQGKIAGVNVTQNDGAPGAGLSIRMRGSNSFLGGTEPLYVIDGVPFNNSSSGSTPMSIGEDEKQTLNAMSFLNPNDIETIDILKDASATAIYGSRGANGVVLITTRKGVNGKDKIEVNFNYGQQLTIYHFLVRKLLIR
jgi:TonB-dependent SusC/RagA subfamily outer membrane receptor